MSMIGILWNIDDPSLWGGECLVDQLIGLCRRHGIEWEAHEMCAVLYNCRGELCHGKYPNSGTWPEATAENKPSPSNKVTHVKKYHAELSCHLSLSL